jgi:hypothetical protein
MGNCATCDDPSIYEQNTEAKPLKQKKNGHNGIQLFMNAFRIGELREYWTSLEFSKLCIR